MTKEKFEVLLDREYRKYLKFLESKGQIYKSGRMTEYANAATDGWDVCQSSAIALFEKITNEEEAQNEGIPNRV